MVKKIKQKTSVKQNVNVRVHVGDTHRKKRRRRQKKSGGGGAEGYPYPPIHAFTPVYIQSGNPPESNPLLSAIQDLNNNVMRIHQENISNPLVKQVENVDKGHIRDTYHRNDNDLNFGNLYPKDDDVSVTSNPSKDDAVIGSSVLENTPPRDVIPHNSPYEEKEDFEPDVVSSTRRNETGGRGGRSGRPRGRPPTRFDAASVARRERNRYRREISKKEKDL